MANFLYFQGIAIVAVDAAAAAESFEVVQTWRRRDMFLFFALKLKPGFLLYFLFNCSLQRCLICICPSIATFQSFFQLFNNLLLFKNQYLNFVGI